MPHAGLEVEETQNECTGNLSSLFQDLKSEYVVRDDSLLLNTQQ